MMRIIIKPRIHITLISMHEGGFRMNGGVGFCIDQPTGILVIQESDKFVFKDERECPLSPSEKFQLGAVIEKVQGEFNLKKCISIKLTGELLTHYGMGSGTSIRLACLEALFLTNGAPIARENLINHSGRGGTSGIGINTYFNGGFVFDLGIKNSGKTFIPSSQGVTCEEPLVLDTIKMPAWKIGLLMPKNIKAKTQEEEVEFFNKTCPIAEDQSHKTLYHSLFGIYASIKTEDMETFAEAIKRIQTLEWKKKEREEYGSKLLNFEQQLYDSGAKCVGMSSLGPLLFFLADDKKIIDIADNFDRTNCDVVLCSVSNSGREIV